MTVKGVKLKSESFFLISPDVLELWRKNLRGAEPPPPDMDRVKHNFWDMRYMNVLSKFKYKFYCIERQRKSKIQTEA